MSLNGLQLKDDKRFHTPCFCRHTYLLSESIRLVSLVPLRSNYLPFRQVMALQMWEDRSPLLAAFELGSQKAIKGSSRHQITTRICSVVSSSYSDTIFILSAYLLVLCVLDFPEQAPP